MAWSAEKTSSRTSENPVGISMLVGVINPYYTHCTSLSREDTL